MMKPLVSILLLLLAIAKTTMGHVRRARSNLTDTLMLTIMMAAPYAHVMVLLLLMIPLRLPY